MTESRNPLRSPLLGASWMALTLGYVILESLAPRGVVGDPLLPGWAQFALLSTEAVALFALVLLGGGVFRLLAIAARGLPARLRRAEPAARIVLWAGALLALGLSWSSFWLSGQFMDRPGLVFAISNLESMLGYALRLHPFLVGGLPVLLLGVAIAADVALPGGLRRLPPAGVAGMRRVVTAGLLLAGAGAVAGEVGHRFLKEKTTDPSTGAVYSREELYRLRRERTAGPLTHLIARGLGPRHPLDLEASGDPPPLERRPLEPLERYLARVDPGSIRRWNVIVVLVDSLRADQLRATGGAREVMPAVEALAREGRVFPDCVAQASHTDYSAPSVFSSHYPLRSRDVYRYPKDPPYPRVMIYDVLKALGWRTALFSSQNEEWGQMINYLQTGGLDVVSHAKSAGGPDPATKERPAFAGTVDDSLTVARAMRWIDSAAEKPFFLYLNLQNSHLPYEVPGDFPRPFGPREIDFKVTIGWFPREKAPIVKDLYADSLSYDDRLLGRLFERLKERGLWDSTLIVVTGDHGEAFYEHDSAAHANGVYEEVIRVPLVLRAPRLAAGRDERPTELLDIAPGIFHLLGLPPHPSFQGLDLFGPDPRPERTRYAISDTPWKTQLGILRKGYKLICDGDTGRAVLYDLGRDPGEKTDVSDLYPQIAKDLRSRLAAWRRAQLDYYENALRQRCEYPPVLRD